MKKIKNLNLKIYQEFKLFFENKLLFEKTKEVKEIVTGKDKTEKMKLFKELDKKDSFEENKDKIKNFVKDQFKDLQTFLKKAEVDENTFWDLGWGDGEYKQKTILNMAFLEKEILSKIDGLDKTNKQEIKKLVDNVMNKLEEFDTAEDITDQYSKIEDFKEFTNYPEGKEAIENAFKTIDKVDDWDDWDEEASDDYTQAETEIKRTLIECIYDEDVLAYFKANNISPKENYFVKNVEKWKAGYERRKEWTKGDIINGDDVNNIIETLKQTKKDLEQEIKTEKQEFIKEINDKHKTQYLFFKEKLDINFPAMEKFIDIKPEKISYQEVVDFKNNVDEIYECHKSIEEKRLDNNYDLDGLVYKVDEFPNGQYTVFYVEPNGMISQDHYESGEYGKVGRDGVSFEHAVKTFGAIEIRKATKRAEQSNKDYDWEVTLRFPDTKPSLIVFDTFDRYEEWFNRTRYSDRHATVKKVSTKLKLTQNK